MVQKPIEILINGHERSNLDVVAVIDSNSSPETPSVLMNSERQEKVLCAAAPDDGCQMKLPLFFDGAS